MCKFCEDMDEMIGGNYYPISGVYGDRRDEEAEVGWFARINPEEKAIDLNFRINGLMRCVYGCR